MKTLPIFLFSSIFSLSPYIMAEDQHDHDHASSTMVEHAKQHGHQHETTETHDADEHKDHHQENQENENSEAHEHRKPHHGGIVSESHPIHHELAHKEGMLFLYAEGLPEDSDKVSVRLTILSGQDKQNLDMRTSEDNHHRFDIEGELQAGDKVVALIKIEDEKPRLVKFEVPTSQ
ncbi:MAG: Unknown protein [uncultured Thiotrichaceae bacterium]|uniref:Uncharacterized protein n=1 Tax=uncultured Thiotrichaceae bacterium TaxID=298394 RepID=A0A6S6TBD2_9GAMM|nr:MAG: Unknown protein [uncultured Thiotrichaceae bacterium]